MSPAPASPVRGRWTLDRAAGTRRGVLTRLGFSNWKSFGPGATIPLRPLTLLVGPNGSGKSNVLDGLRFLQGAAMDLPLGDVLRGRYEGQREVWPGIRGHLAEAVRSGQREFQIESQWADNALGAASGAHDEVHLVRVSIEGEARVEEERLGPEDEYGYWTRAPVLKQASGRAGDGIRAALRASAQGASPVLDYSAGRLLLGQIAPADRVREEVVTRARGLQRQLREIIFLDVQPGRMRDYRPAGASQLGVNAENISPILHGLDGRQRGDVVDWLSELSAPSIEAIDIEQTRLGEVMMYLVERGGAKISARSVSDGTLRFLGLVVALLTVPTGAMLVLEEPDVGLHPSRVHLLARLLEETARRRRIQILATTHSPQLLAQLSESALRDVIAFGRDPAAGTTIARRVGELQHFDTLRDSPQLDHLVSTGWLERAL